MSKVQSFKNTFDKLLADASKAETHELALITGYMVREVVNKIAAGDYKKPIRKKPIPKNTIARLGPLSDAIRAAGRERRGEVAKDEYLEGIMNRSKPKIVLVKHSDLTKAEYQSYANKGNFKGRAAFVIELLQAQTAGQLIRSKGIFKCPCCGFKTTETGTYRFHKDGVTLRWFNNMDHMTQVHGVPPPEDFMLALMPSSYHSKIECR